MSDQQGFKIIFWGVVCPYCRAEDQIDGVFLTGKGSKQFCLGVVCPYSQVQDQIDGVFVTIKGSK